MGIIILIVSQCLLGDKEEMNEKSRCCSLSSDFDPLTTNNMPMPPGPPKSHPPRSSDVERMSEKYWGEILERTLSSTSLHALQQSFSGNGGSVGLHHSHSRTPLAHHSNRFNQSPSMLTNQTSVLSLNHIARDRDSNGGGGYDPFRSSSSNSNLYPHHSNNHRHSYMGNGDTHQHHHHLHRDLPAESKDNGNVASEDEDDDDEEGDEEGDEEEDMEETNGEMEDMEETSNSDSVQEDRGGGGGGGGGRHNHGPRVSFISNSEAGGLSHDYSVHDKNCAKAKALNAQVQSVKGLPGM